MNRSQWLQRQRDRHEAYLDRICARQAKRDGWLEDRSSPLRAMDALNPFKWIAAVISERRSHD